jgi:hypothetical protein
MLSYRRKSIDIERIIVYNIVIEHKEAQNTNNQLGWKRPVDSGCRKSRVRFPGWRAGGLETPKSNGRNTDETPSEAVTGKDEEEPSSTRRVR